VIVAAYSLVWLCVHAAGALRPGALEAGFYMDLATLALAFGAALRAAPTDTSYWYEPSTPSSIDVRPDSFYVYLSGRPAIKASIAFTVSNGTFAVLLGVFPPSLSLSSNPPALGA